MAHRGGVTCRPTPALPYTATASPVRSSNPDLRASAYQELYRVYGEDASILGQMYQTRVRDWYNEGITLRKFKTPNSVRNLMNDIPDEAVDALRGAFRCGDLPWAFEPGLPWFRSLEGYPPYDELLRERDRRIARTRAALEQLDAPLT